MKILANLSSLIKRTDANLPFGKTVQDETPTQAGTPIVADWFQDLLSNFYRLLEKAKITPTNDFDSDLTQYQIIDALQKLPNTLNDVEKVLTLDGTTWNVDLDLDILPNKYFFLARASDDYDVAETYDFKGSGDDTYSFTSNGAFVTGGLILVVIDLSGVRAYPLSKVLQNLQKVTDGDGNNVTTNPIIVNWNLDVDNDVTASLGALGQVSSKDNISQRIHYLSPGGFALIDDITGNTIQLLYEEFTGNTILIIPSENGTIATREFVNTKTGWAQYTDTKYTSASPLVIASGTRSKLVNNANTILKTQLPIGVTDFFNKATNKLVGVNVNDVFQIDIRFKAKTSVTNDYFDISIDIGGALNEITEDSRVFTKGANVEQTFNIHLGYFTGATFLANGGDIFIQTHNGDLSFYGINYLITRVHKGI